MAEHEDVSEFIPSWFWWVGAGLCVGVVALVVLWYVKHPDRSIFEDFARREPLGVPESNGMVPHPATSAGQYVDPSPQ